MRIQPFALTLIALVLGSAIGVRADDRASPPTVGDPGAAILGPLHALRANDIGALVAVTARGRETLAESWKQATSNRDPFLSDRLDELIGTLVAANAHDALLSDWSKRISQAGTDALASAIADLAHPSPASDRAGGEPGMMGRGPRGGDWRSLVGGMLARVFAMGLESQQASAVQHLFESAASWVKNLDLNDQAKQDAVITAVLASVHDLGLSRVDDLAALSLDEALARSGRALQHLKDALQVYGISIDAIIDSARIIAVQDAGGASEATIVVVAVTVFGQEHRFPFKVVSRGGTWHVAADSPLANWMGQRMPLMMQILVTLLPPPDFGPGGPGGPGGPDQGRVPPKAQPKSENGF
jgi:hypothetical protein